VKYVWSHSANQLCRGKRDELVDILRKERQACPGCQSYVIAYDSNNPNAIWITEVWDTKESHAASLNLPDVQSAISQGQTMILGFGSRVETSPIHLA
jgi:quinol monooxygenase YgiN